MRAPASPVRGSRGGSARYLWSHWRLLLRVTGQDLRLRHAGSLLGLSWIAIGPLLILGVYALIYLEVFKVRATALPLSRAAFVIYIFCGLVPYLATAEAMTRGVSSVITNKAVLNNTVYPIDLTPVEAALGAQAIVVVGMPLVILGAILSGHAHPTLVLVPVVWTLMFVWVTGVNWLFSMLNVAFRDLQNLLTVILMVLLVASPFAYTTAQLPPAVRPIVYLNPFAYFVVAFQQLIVLGQLPDAKHTAVLVVMSIATFVLGSWFFSRAKGVLLDYV
ncbi:MAG TPA: ABC transporter permease [Acidimicrobiales bacterium]|nr:ABC transporter permease [Acidimicrobiales bacterium]